MKALRILTGLSYPFLIYAGLDLVGPRALAVFVAVVLIAEGVFTPTRASVAHVSWLMLAAAVLWGAAILAGLLNDGRLFLFVPVLINGALLIAFGRTLVKGPSIVEIFARLRRRSLPAEEVLYCRLVTGIWCVVFVLNGALTLALALYASLAWWTLYTGALSYMLIGMVFATELVYRYWRFRPYDGSITDPLFRRIFPPRGDG
jgi:uncharacterized membrane protein